MSFRWAIWGTGDISAKFAAGLASAGATAAVVASRELGTAQKFASQQGVAKAVAGYDPAQLVGQADAVYIATPTGLHAEHAIACLNAGLPVLVEKPLAASLADAERVVAVAREKKKFLMEGMWTRFMPAVLALKQANVGTLNLLSGGFAISNAVEPKRPLFQPGFGGGAIRQYGVYPLALGQLIAGRAESIVATGRIGETGIETTVSLTVKYASGVVGNYYASLETTGENGFVIHGTHGRTSFVGPIYRPTGLRKASFTPRQQPQAGKSGGGMKSKLIASPLGQKLVQAIQHRRGPGGKAVAHGFAGNGYNLEAAEAQRCIKAGLTESPLMPLEDSIELVRLVDDALQQIGVRA
jgi:predicted dehydrogenase